MGHATSVEMGWRHHPRWLSRRAGFGPSYTTSAKLPGAWRIGLPLCGRACAAERLDIAFPPSIATHRAQRSNADYSRLSGSDLGQLICYGAGTFALALAVDAAFSCLRHLR